MNRNFGWNASRLALLAGWGIGLCFAAGCSGSREMAPVSGKVTLNGQPLADVRVMFQPVQADAGNAEADAMGSFGTTDAQGLFVLYLSDCGEPGALVGEHRVVISDKATESDSDGGYAPVKKSRVPLRYADGSLSFKVEPEGSDQANFELKSG
jgi:hypothetical protein